MGDESVERLARIEAAWQEVSTIRVYRGSYILIRLDAYKELIRQLMELGRPDLLLELVRGVADDFPAVGILREDAVRALLEAGAVQEARAVSRLRYAECGQQLGILIGIAAATHDPDDIERVRAAIRRRVDMGPLLVIWLIRAWHEIREDKELKEAYEVADFLPPLQKAEAYAAIGLRTLRREDFLTSFQATDAIRDAAARNDVRRRIAEVMGLTVGAESLAWVVGLSVDPDRSSAVN